MSRRSFLVAALAVALVPAFARAADEPKEVVTKAVKAHGGEAFLKKYAAVASNEKGKIDLPGIGEVDFTSETAYMLPNKFKQVLSFTVMNQDAIMTIKMLGDEAFGEMAIAGMKIDLTKDLKETLKDVPHQLQVAALYPLLDKEYSLGAFGEEKVNDKPAIGITVSKKGQKDVTLFFDKDTYLLVRMDSRTAGPSGAEVNETRIFEEYAKTKDGIPYPKKVLVKHDDKKFIYAETTELQFAEKLPDADFKK